MLSAKIVLVALRETGVLKYPGSILVNILLNDMANGLENTLIQFMDNSIGGRCASMLEDRARIEN